MSMQSRQSNLSDSLRSIIALEMRIYKINRLSNNKYKLYINGKNIKVSSSNECSLLIKNFVNSIKKNIWNCWNELNFICLELMASNSKNYSSFDNTLFLYNLKRTHELASYFSDLEFVYYTLRQIFYLDIQNFDGTLIRNFNDKCLEIRCLHSVIMKELYRIKLIERFNKLAKTAQISGPWANLDLPASERMWSWDEDEEYFENRKADRRAQTRYNPEYTSNGYYLVWQDYRRDPYRFEDMKTDSPYPSRHLLTIP